MSQKPMLYVLICFLGLLVCSPILQAQVEEIVEGEVFVTFKKGASEAEKTAVLQKYGLRLIKFYELFGFGLYQTNQETLEVIEKLKKEPAVIQAGPNHFRSANAVPNDPYYGSQWYLPKINWANAWTEFTGTQEVKVAVVDSGVSKTHLQLTTALTSSGERDYYDNDTNAEDGFGHGTLVAGIIAARINDGSGVAGISPTAKILPLRVFDNAGRFAQATTDAIVSSIQQSISQGVKVINLSLSSAGYNENERLAIAACRNYGILVVCAAGNGGGDGVGDNIDSSPIYPAGYNLDNILSIAATDENDNLTGFSNYGATSVHLAAPGQQILGCDVARKILYEWSFDLDEEGWMPFVLNGFGWIRTLAFAQYFGDAGITTSSWSGDSTGFYQADSTMSLYSPIINLEGQRGSRLEVWLGGYLGVDDYLGINTCASDYSNLTFFDYLAYPGWNYQKVEKDVSVFDGQIGRAVITLYADLLGIGRLSSGQVGIQGARITALDQGVSAGNAQRFNSGTSFSAPMVSGVAAMLFSQNPSLTYSQVRQIILDKTRKVSALNGKVVSGGIVDAAAALREAKARMVVAPSITSSPTASATVGTAFSYAIRATNTPTSYNATGRPAWMSVNTNTGVISGTPTAAGTHNITISASNAAGSGSATLTLTVTGLAPLITSSTTARGAVGSAFTYTITASRSPASYNATGLPSGFSVNRTNGMISGTPTKAGTNNITISASNSSGVGTAVVSLRVSKGNPRIISAPVASNITDGQTLSQSGLIGGSVSISGIFSWGTPSLIPLVSSSLQTVRFTPTDGSNYNAINTSVGVTVVESTNLIKRMSNCFVAAIPSSSLRFNGLRKAFVGKAAPTNVSSRTALMLSSIGDPINAYGIISTLGASGFRSVTNLGIDGVFRPHRTSTIISSTGLTFNFPTNLVSSNPGGDTARPPWKKTADSTGGSTAAMNTHFTALGVNWETNSLFAVPCAGITFDLLEIKPTGREFTKFSTFFAMHSGNPVGDASYAILLDGRLVRSGVGFTATTPYSQLIEVDLPLNTRFLTLVVGDNGDNYDWDHGVFVNPVLYANTAISTTVQYVGVNKTVYGPSTNPPINAGEYRLSITDSSSRYTGAYTTNFTISKAMPVITRAPTSSVITFGQSLASSTLNNGLANVAGAFGWVSPTNKPAKGTSLQPVLFTPTSPTNFYSVVTNIILRVN